MSLVDLGMVPFVSSAVASSDPFLSETDPVPNASSIASLLQSTNYLMVVSLSFIILCGNQALPLLLRLLV
jgi:hypothetical protein